MGKLVCQCGYIFDLTPDPEAYMWIAVNDRNLLPFISAEIESERLVKDGENNKNRIKELDQSISHMKSLIYNCPTCNRIIWYRGEDGEFEVFRPESG